MPGIALAYIGVHQMFQLALAAEEAGCLERHYCSWVDAPGKWGRTLARWSHASSARPVGSENIPPAKLREIPLPMLSRRVRSFLNRGAPSDYYESNEWFDSAVARRLTAESSASVYVGAETCALHSIRAARRKGMKTILDCPGIPAEFLSEQTEIAAAELDIPVSKTTASPRMNKRKEEEMAEADYILLCSEFQRNHYLARGMDASRLRVNPLWVDPSIAAQAAGQPTPRTRQSSAPLRVLFVGAATVAKGAPYALLAAGMLGEKVRLTFCGGVDEAVARWAGDRMKRHRVIPWLPRSELAAIYREHDVLIFPTLGDSFGFVALEAMACGLPVITTTNAGAPMPYPEWRVTPRNAEALAARLQVYIDDEAKLDTDSRLAREFVRDFTPERFRQRARNIFQEAMGRA